MCEITKALIAVLKTRSAVRQIGQYSADRRLLLRKPLDQITEFRLEQNYGEALQLLQTRLTQTLLPVSTTRAGNRSGLLSCSAFLAIWPGQKLPPNTRQIRASSPPGDQTELLQTACNKSICFQVAVTQAFFRLDPICEPFCGDSAYQKLCEENQP
jgi:hypothetical protein